MAGALIVIGCIIAGIICLALIGIVGGALFAGGYVFFMLAFKVIFAIILFAGIGLVIVFSILKVIAMFVS